MKLYRPHIPIDVRIEVARRQVKENDATWALHWVEMNEKKPAHLKRMLDGLKAFLGCDELQLHHRPALENRPQRQTWTYVRGKRRKITVYDPPANDSYSLFYIPKHDHHIETHVRGLGAKRSDTGERNHQKALDRNRGLRRRKPKVKIKSRGFQQKPKGYKHQWGKR